MQGDIVAIYNASGTKIGTYTYDAWGNGVATMLNASGVDRLILLSYNPFRYRGYYYDSDSGWYYLQSRYYNPTWGRFISVDAFDVLTATPNQLTDKNIFAYCDNNPITRIDEDGEFWLIRVAIGLATQYAGDVVGNLLAGKTGLDILKPTSSGGEYVAAGVTALITGAGFGVALIRNIVAEGITMVEDTIRGEEVNVANSLINIGLGSVIDVGFEKVSGKIDDFMRSKMPQNYSSYACDVRKVNPGITQNQIKSKMRRAINVNRAVYKGISYGLDFSRSFLPY